MSDGRLWMTDLSNRDRLASDERFDRRFSGDRKVPVEGDVRTDHDHAAGAPRNSGLTSADGDVIDLMEEPRRAERDRIVAVPTLIRRWPGAVTRIIGDLSNSECVLTRLNIDVRPMTRRR